MLLYTLGLINQGKHTPFELVLLFSQVVAEGVSQSVRCTLVLVGVITSPQYGLLVFAFAQVNNSNSFLLYLSCEPHCSVSMLIDICFAVLWLLYNKAA